MENDWEMSLKLPAIMILITSFTLPIRRQVADYFDRPNDKLHQELSSMLCI